MWSRKPTPVVRLPAPDRRGQRQRDVGLPRLARDLRAAGSSRRPFSRTSIEAAWTREALGPRDRRAGAGERGGRGADPDLAHAPAEVARRRAARRTGPRRRSAACGSSPRRSRRTPWPLSRADEHAAGAAHARRERLGRGADELEVLGGEGLGEGEGGLEVGRVDERRRAASPGSSVDRVQQRRRRRDRRTRPCPSPCSAWAAGRGHELGVGPGRGEHDTSLGPAKPSIPTSPETSRLASCTHRLPGPAMTSARAIVSVP